MHHIDDNGPRHRKLDRMPAPAPDRFAATLSKRNFPVILTGGMDGWPALNSWNPIDLAHRFGDLEFSPSIDFPVSGRPYEQIWSDYHQKMTLRQFADLIKSTDKACYIRRQQISKWPGAGSDFAFDKLFPDDPHGERAFIWFGANTLTPLHFDTSHGVLCQLHGTKQVYLISPQDSKFLYPYAHSCMKSRVLPSKPDLVAFPNFRKATVLEGDLNPGEMLFLPRCWWHSVVANGSSISISREFDESMPWREVPRVLSAAGVEAWLATGRDFIWHGLMQRPHQRRLFDDPPFGAVLFNIVKQGLLRKFRLNSPEIS